MANTLSAWIVSRYPADRLLDILAIDSPHAWMAEKACRLQTALHLHSAKPLEMQTSPEGLLFGLVVQQQIPSDEVAIHALRTWADIFIQDIAHFPILFFLAWSASPRVLDETFIDEGIYRIGGPLILIDEEIWNQSLYARDTFTGSGTAPFFKKTMSVIIREPENAWFKKAGEALHQSKDTKGRHNLTYAQNEESHLPVEIQKERKQLDNVVNIPSPGQRKSLKPSKVSIHLQKRERADSVSCKAYQDVPIGQNKDGNKTLGGRSLLVSCNKDTNLIAGWRDGDSDFEVHNAASLHFAPSVKPGSLPEAMTNGRVILKNAWIKGLYIPPELPNLKKKPNRMIWPQYNLPKSTDNEKKE
jgi:hypothetical protein